MEIAIEGEGEVVFRFIDANGRTLFQEKITVSGSETVQARRIIALSVRTRAGRAQVAPVLLRQSNEKQRITFDGEAPSRFTRKRCEEIGCAVGVSEEAERGCAPPPAGDFGATLTDDPALNRLLATAAQGKTNPGK